VKLRRISPGVSPPGTKGAESGATEVQRFGVDLAWDKDASLWKIEARGGPHCWGSRWRWSSECGDSSAVINFAPGATMTATQMQTIWNSVTPSLSQQLPFLACAATQASKVTVNVQYRN